MERIEMGDTGWEEVEKGVFINKSTGQKIVVAEKKLYDKDGKLIKDLEDE